MRTALVFVSCPMLGDVLRLPTDIQVVGVHVDPDRDCLVVKVIGNGLPIDCERPVDSTAIVTEIRPIYRRDADGRVELVELG